MPKFLCSHLRYVNLSYNSLNSHLVNFSLCGSRKYPYSPHRRDWKFRGGGGSQRPKNLKQCMKLNWNFQRGGGGGGHRANPFRGGYGYFLEPYIGPLTMAS